MIRRKFFLPLVGLMLVVLAAACTAPAPGLTVDITSESPTVTTVLPTSTPTLPPPTLPPPEMAPLHLGWVWQPKALSLWPMVTVDDSGTFYVADQAGALHALTAQGEELWSVKSDCGDAYPPVLSTDGSQLYFVANKDVPHVCALNVDGTPLWQAPLEDLKGVVPVVAPDGTLHLRTDTGVVRISPDGAVTEHTLPEELKSLLGGSPMPPAFDGSGNIYYALQLADQVVVLSPDYEVSAECDVGTMSSEVVASGDAGFIIAVEPGEIVSFDASCGERWRYEVFEDKSENTMLVLAMGPDNVLYVAGPGGLLLALTEDGRQLWQNEIQADAPEVFSLAIGADGTIAAAGDNPTTVLAYGAQGEPLLVQRLYKIDDTGVPVPVPNGGVAQVHEGQLKVYTNDPTMIVEVPPPAPPPNTVAEAEAEIVPFMVDMIVSDDIEDTLQYIEDSDWYGTGPTENVIVWRSVLEDKAAQTDTPAEPLFESLPELDEDNPLKVWTYGNGELVEVAAGMDQKRETIDAYRETHMDMDTEQSIFAWGYYEFAIVSLDASLQKADVYRSASCGPLCGSGFLLTLERSPDGFWFVSESAQLWQS